MSDEYTAVDAKIDAAYVAWLTANGLRHGDSYFAGATFAAGFRAALDTLIPVEPTPEIQEPGRSEAEVKAEALREFADWWGAGQWAEDFMAYDVEDDESAVRAMCRALTDRASRLAGTTEAGDES